MKRGGVFLTFVPVCLNVPSLPPIDSTIMLRIITPAVSRVFCFMIPVVVFATIIHDLAEAPANGSFDYSLSQGKLISK